MPVCPNCNKESPRRSKGSCPECGAPVMLYKGRWFVEDSSSPAEQILDKFEVLISDKIDAPFYFAKSSVKMELVFAQQLLEDVGWELDLAFEVLEILFKHENFAWKNRHSLMDTKSDLSAALAIARKRRKQREKQEAREQENYENAMQEDELFEYEEDDIF